MKKDPEVEHANQVSIIDFAEAAGISLNQISSDCFKGVEHDSLVITPSRNAWFWNSHEKGGYGALSFAKDYVLRNEPLSDRAKFVRALKMVSKYELPSSSIKSFSNATENVSKFSFTDLNLTQKFQQTNDYLTKIRKINPALVTELHKHGLIGQDKKANAVFIRRNPINNQIIGGSIQGTVIDFNTYQKHGSFKGVAKNSRPNSAWVYDLCQSGQVPHNIMIFEAPIDAMSYCTYQALLGKSIRDTRYVAMDGLKEKTALNYIAITQKQLAAKNDKLTSVSLAVDNDTAGNSFIQKMINDQNIAFHEQKNIECSDSLTDFAKDLYLSEITEKNKILIKTPVYTGAQPSVQLGKDWNDVLISGNKKNFYKSAKLDSSTKGLTSNMEMDNIEME